MASEMHAVLVRGERLLKIGWVGVFPGGNTIGRRTKGGLAAEISAE